MPLPQSFIAPLNTAGGWQIAEHTQYRTPDGVEVDYDVLSPKQYASPEACQAAIDMLQGRALARAA